MMIWLFRTQMTRILQIKYDLFLFLLFFLSITATQTFICAYHINLRHLRSLYSTDAN